MTAAVILIRSGVALFVVGLVLGLIVWIPRWIDGLGWPWDPKAWKRRVRRQFEPMRRGEAKLWLIGLALLVAGAALIAIGRAIR
jgi:uncharacterized protein YjeT (DUF2065 family)